MPDKSKEEIDQIMRLMQDEMADTLDLTEKLLPLLKAEIEIMMTPNKSIDIDKVGIEAVSDLNQHI